MAEHPRAGAAGWVLLALAGIAIAVALSVAASNLSTQPIGLSGEPLRAGDRLAPAVTTKPSTSRSRTGTATATTPGPAQTSTGTSTATTPSEPRFEDRGAGDPDHDDD